MLVDGKRVAGWHAVQKADERGDSCAGSPVSATGSPRMAALARPRPAALPPRPGATGFTLR